MDAEKKIEHLTAELSKLANEQARIASRYTGSMAELSANPPARYAELSMEMKKLKHQIDELKES